MDDSAALYYIQKGGSLMKQGFSWLGGMMATGVNKSGQYIQSKINSNPKEKKVSDSTKSTFEQIKANTNQSIKVAGGIITQLVTPIAKFGNQVIEGTSLHFTPPSTLLKKIYILGLKGHALSSRHHLSV